MQCARLKDALDGFYSGAAWRCTIKVAFRVPRGSGPPAVLPGESQLGRGAGNPCQLEVSR
jgi:hypothetical protein